MIGWIVARTVVMESASTDSPHKMVNADTARLNVRASSAVDVVKLKLVERRIRGARLGRAGGNQPIPC
jgi:hypothetical protein